MKKFLIMMLLSCAISTEMSAQEVYKYLHEKASKVVHDANADKTLRMFNQFKVDALDYMVIKMKEVMPDSSATFLDEEAYAMNNFVSLYMRTMLNNRTEPTTFQVKLIQLFMDASISNPLFNDSDYELIHSYLNDKDGLTRFSLDTDWRRAYLAAATELKKMKKL